MATLFRTLGAIVYEGFTTTERDALNAQERMTLWNTTDTEWQMYLSGDWRAVLILDADGNITAAQHGTLSSDDLHPEYARVAAPEDITSSWALRSGGSVRATPGDPPVGEVVIQVKTSTGAPSHSASQGTFCWVAPDDDVYINNNGGTSWTKQAKDSALHPQSHTLASHSTKPHSALSDAPADVHTDTKVRTKEVNEDNIANGKVLVYRTASGKLEYETPSGGGGKASKSLIYMYPDTDLAAGDFLPDTAIRVPATGKHGTWTWGTMYVRCKVVGTGTNTLRFSFSSTITGARTYADNDVALGTGREGSVAITWAGSSPGDGEYLWVECSEVGGTVPQKVTVQVDIEEDGY